MYKDMKTNRLLLMILLLLTVGFTDAQRALEEKKRFTLDCVNFDMILVESGKTSDGVEMDHSYYIGKYEVTQALWKLVMKTTPFKFSGKNPPAEKISYSDIMAKGGFLDKLNAKFEGVGTFRLPTSEEWEFAARGGIKGKDRSYKYVGSDDLEEVAWYSENSRKTTWKVGTKTPNVLGIYDMSGNVMEWTSSIYKELPIVRGGSWDHSEFNCRTTYWASNEPDKRYTSYGFRLVFVPASEDNQTELNK